MEDLLKKFVNKFNWINNLEVHVFGFKIIMIHINGVY
jgi:hypothetical protein